MEKSLKPPSRRNQSMFVFYLENMDKKPSVCKKLSQNPCVQNALICNKPFFAMLKPNISGIEMDKTPKEASKEARHPSD